MDLAWAQTWPKAGRKTELHEEANIALCIPPRSFDYRKYPEEERERVAKLVLDCFQQKKDVSFLFEARSRPRGLFFDLEFKKGMEHFPNIPAVELHKVICNCLRLVVPRADIFHKERMWSAYWVDGSRPDKPLSYHVHFPHIVMSKAAMLELYQRLLDLVEDYPGNADAHLIRHLIDPAVVGGGNVDE